MKTRIENRYRLYVKTGNAIVKSEGYLMQEVWGDETPKPIDSGYSAVYVIEAMQKSAQLHGIPSVYLIGVEFVTVPVPEEEA